MTFRRVLAISKGAKIGNSTVRGSGVSRVSRNLFTQCRTIAGKQSFKRICHLLNEGGAETWE